MYFDGQLNGAPWPARAPGLSLRTRAGRDMGRIGIRLSPADGVSPPALGLVAPGAWLVALVKPQFEVDKGCGSRALPGLFRPISHAYQGFSGYAR